VISEEALRSGKLEAIRQAATHVFATKGYHDATVSEIARVANVGKGTVYFYYPSKEDILLAILEFHFERMMTLIEGIEQLDAEPVEAIRIVLRDAMRRLEEDPDLFRIMEQQPLLYHERVKERFERLFGDMVDRVARLLEAGTERGVLRSFDSRAVASVLLSSAISFPLYLSVCADETGHDALRRLTDEMADLIWTGLRPTRTDPTSER